MSDEHGEHEVRDGGDPVCWLERLCPECGAMPSPDSPQRCWRCGRLRDVAEPDG
jgi:hypothetical protein